MKSRLVAALLGALTVSCLTMPAAAATVIAAFSIPILNGQSSSAGVGFQQQVNFNPSTYQQFEASDLGNILFCADAACNTPLPSWLEGCEGAACTPSASLATAWVKLNSAVPAGGSTIIYLAFQPTTTEFDGVNWGEAPQWSTPYGAYDNGANVFVEYGGGGPSAWSSFTLLSGTWTTTGGPLQQISTTTSVDLNGGPAAILTGLSLPATGQYVIETAFSYSGQQDARVGIVAVSSITTPGPDLYGYRFLGQQDGNGAGFLSFLNDEVTWVVNNVTSGTINTPYTMQVTDNAGVWSGNLYPGYSTTGTPVTSLSTTAYSAPNLQGNATGYIGLSAGWYTSTAATPNNVVIGNPATFQWFRVRSLPPGDVEPSALTPSLCASVILNNTSPTLATPAPFQQSLTFYPTTYASIERPDLGNIRYCADDQCATPLYAWLEGCNGAGNGACSPTASSATVWVKLTSSIAPSSSLTIYQCFVSTSVDFDAGFWGESTDEMPNLDNGSNVFSYYNNGRSTMTAAGIGAFTLVNGGTIGYGPVANPYGVKGSSVLALTPRNNAADYETVAWYNNAVSSDNMVLEGWASYFTSATVNGTMLAAKGASVTGANNYLFGIGWTGTNAGAMIAEPNVAADTILATSTGARPPVGWAWSYNVLQGTNLTSATYPKPPEFGTGALASTAAVNAPLNANNQFIGLAARANAVLPAYFYQWRARVYFPGAVGVSVDSTTPAAVANLSAAPIGTSSATLSWSAPTDPDYNPMSGQYAIQYASYTTGVVWSTANAQVYITTSGVTPGVSQGAFVSFLNPNTTYYFYLWTEDQGLRWSPLSNGATAVTLANPINAAAGLPLSITASSVTVKWAALPPSPSSSTCEGYELDVSTTNFASGTVYSSTTFSELASTLAVAGLNTGTTMYFRVATLNWNGGLDYVYLSSANIQISPSIATIVMGLNSLVAVSTISVSSVVVTNVGNLPLTLVVSGSTTTAGSPWILSVSSGVEQPVLQGEWNSTQPTISTFATSITSAAVVSGAAGGNYAGGQAGKAIPSGGSVTMWFQFWAPTSTTAANTPEAIQVLYQAIYP